MGDNRPPSFWRLVRRLWALVLWLCAVFLVCLFVYGSWLVLLMATSLLLGIVGLDLRNQTLFVWMMNAVCLAGSLYLAFLALGFLDARLGAYLARVKSQR